MEPSEEFEDKIKKNVEHVKNVENFENIENGPI